MSNKKHLVFLSKVSKTKYFSISATEANFEFLIEEKKTVQRDGQPTIETEKCFAWNPTKERCAKITTTIALSLSGGIGIPVLLAVFT